MASETNLGKSCELRSISHRGLFYECDSVTNAKELENQIKKGKVPDTMGWNLFRNGTQLVFEPKEVTTQSTFLSTLNSLYQLPTKKPKELTL